MLGLECEHVRDLEPKAIIRNERRRGDDLRAQLEANCSCDEARLAERVDHASLVSTEVTDEQILEVEALVEPGNHDIAAHAPLVLEVREAAGRRCPRVGESRPAGIGRMIRAVPIAVSV